MRTLHFLQKAPRGKVALPLSKSLCNRALILAAQFPQIKIAALSNAADTVVLSENITKTTGTIDVGAAGTAMRFLAAYFAAQAGTNITLTGTTRMQQRPIAPLVAALRDLGGKICFLSNEGFPPLHIKGVSLQGSNVTLPANVSSQYVSALMLIGAKMPEGLTLTLTGEPVSASYLNMTAGLMRQMGFSVAVSEYIIRVEPAKNIPTQTYQPEADWSAAAFWYGILAVATEGEIVLPNLRPNSLQGDSRVAHIFAELGVKTTFSESGATLTKRAAQLPNSLVINLKSTPDLAQPLAFACAALGIGADFRGLQTLRIKETDRLLALKTELANVGVLAHITTNRLRFEATHIHPPKKPFATYQDHRMAMSAAILAPRFALQIENPEVVTKSYPQFWHVLDDVFGS